MSYTAGSQGAQANCASVFMATLDTILLAAGFTAVTWPGTTVRLASGVNVASLSGLLVVDGVQTVDNDRVLCVNQTTTSQNGIWVAHSGAWTRATDADASGEITVGQSIRVTEGSTATNRVYYVSATGATPWIPGTSSSTWANQGPMTINAYKSPAASNSFGSDWYLLVYRATDTSTACYFGVAEILDTVTGKVRNYAPAAGYSGVPAATTFAVNDTVGLPPFSTRQIAITISAAGFQYWVSANPNRVVVGARVASTNYKMYAGLYDDILSSTISPFPLIVTDLLVSSSAGNGSGSATREPNTTTSNTGNFGVNVFYPLGLNSDSATGIYAGTLVPGRPIVYSSRIVASTSVGSSAIGARGILKDVIRQGITGSVMGDTLTVTDAASNVKTYTCFDPVQYWVDQGV